MKCFFIAIVLVLFFCVSCSEKTIKSEQVQHISIKSETKKVIGDPYSFKHVEIVPLDNDDACLMGAVMQIEVVDSLLFIKDMYERLYLFKRDGTFIRQIGSEGQGPGEYLLLSSFYVDKEKQQVVILDDVKGNLLYYGFNGTFLGNRKIPIDYIRRVKQSLLVSEGDILINNYFNFEENMGYTHLNVSDDTITYKKLFPYAPIFIRDHLYAFSKHAMQKSGDEIHFIMPLCDTIYAYAQKKFYPKYVVETPQKMVDKRDFSDISTANPYFMVMLNAGQKGRFTGFTELFETDDMILLNYKDNGGPLGFYVADKNSWSGNYYLHTNSFDKQVPVLPIVGSTQNQFIGSVECDFLLQFRDQIDVTRPEYAPLKEIVEGNHVDYNPILVFYSN